MSQFETQAGEGQPPKKGAGKLGFKRRMAAKRAKESASPHGAVDEGSVFIALERKGGPDASLVQLLPTACSKTPPALCSGFKVHLHTQAYGMS